MKKSIVFLLILLSCKDNGKNKNVPIEFKPNADTFTIPTNHMETTHVDLIPLNHLPGEFKLDSTVGSVDIVSDYINMKLYYPVSKTDSNWNRKIRSFIQKNIDAYYDKKVKPQPVYSDFEMYIIAMDTLKHAINCKFYIQSFYGGAAHYNLDSTNFVYKK